MEKLPLRPLVFIPTYLVLFVASVLVSAPGLEVSAIWGALLGLTLFALHFTWMFRALAFASKRRGAMGGSRGAAEAPTTFLRFLVLMVLCFGVGELYEAYLQPAITGGSSLDQAIEAVFALLTIYFLVGMHWMSACAVCEAEMGRKASTFSIVSTAILFFFILIGAPFIYQRLKKLNEPLSDGLAGTA